MTLTIFVFIYQTKIERRRKTVDAIHMKKYFILCSASRHPVSKYMLSVTFTDSMITVQHADREDYWFYCFAQNTMVPTVEETRISAIISRARHVVVGRIIERVYEKTNNLGFRPGPTQTRLYRHRIKLET